MSLRSQRRKLKSLDIEKLKKEWFEENQPLGKKLGYPDCCIKQFCDQHPEILKLSTRTSEDLLRYECSFINGKYTGFFPCTKHAFDIYEDKTTLSDLIQNRDPEFPPFPNF